MGVRRVFCVEGGVGIWVILLSGLCSRVTWGAVGVNLQSGVVAYQAVHVGVTVVFINNGGVSLMWLSDRKELSSA